MYSFTGFFAPIDNGGVLNLVKAGSAAKFSCAVIGGSMSSGVG
jgi:hypothetical protein